jgi:hypothetical protein
MSPRIRFFFRDLVLNPEKQRRIGMQSRQYAVKWQGMKACAARYERAYDRLFDLDVQGAT